MAKDPRAEARVKRRQIADSYQSGGPGRGSVDDAVLGIRPLTLRGSFITAPSGMTSWEGPTGGTSASITTGPTTGPSPIIRSVEYAPSQPASGPKAMAQFVAPNFNRAGPKEVVPTGATERALTRLSALAPFARPAEEEPEEEERPRIPVLDPPPTRPALGVGKPGGGLTPTSRTIARRPGMDVVPYDDIIDAEIVEQIGTKYPALGQEIIDAETWDNSLPPGSVGAIGPGPIAIGPAGDPGALSQAFDFGNAYHGQNPGRRATRGTRKAYKDPNQGQILGNDWEAY